MPGHGRMESGNFDLCMADDRGEAVAWLVRLYARNRTGQSVFSKADNERDKKQLRIVDGFVFGRHDDLEEFAIVRPTHNCVADAWRLDPARTSY